MGMPACTITSQTAHGGVVVLGFPQVLINFMPASRIGDMQGYTMGMPAGVSVNDDEDMPATVAHEVVRYPDAEHGFHCDRRPSYQEAAATDGWRRTLGWLARHLGR